MMKNEPLVSIVTPSFNQGEFIEDNILSIKNQTYPQIEHIIVDGGSSDQTLDVIRRVEGTYDMRWLSEPDEGMYHAINKGLRLARGDILAYLNCDDFYLPWSVETAVRHLDKHELVFGDVIRVDLATNEVMLSFTPPFVSAYYRAVGIIVQPAVFFSRRVIDQVGYFDESFRSVGDCEYWLRCDSAGIRPRKVWEFLAVERVHEDTKRLRNAVRLRSELARVRAMYGDWKTRVLFPYRLITYLYWRVALSVYVLDRPTLWKRLKQSNVVSYGWSFCLNQLLPKAIRRSRQEEPTGAVVLAWLRPLLCSHARNPSPDNRALANYCDNPVERFQR